jgi:FtsP/CotA-like multicopper oxidase with cupredoxin domain
MSRDSVSPRPGLRRPLLGLLGAAALGAVVIAGGDGPRTAQGAPRGATVVMDGPVPADTDRVRLRMPDRQRYEDSLREPAVIRAVDGVLNATVTVEMATLPVPRGRDSTQIQNLRAYRLTATTDPSYGLNDPRFAPHFPGPTFRVRRGDLVQIELVNALPQGGPADANDVCKQATVTTNPVPIPDVYQACFHGLNYTNIHYHGMHVTPDSTSTMVGDDVLMTIPPGGTLQYSFRIPQNQSPGTHWYHPHKHGSVAMQVANGMAGAFIVEDPQSGLDSIVRHLGMREHLIAIQQVAESFGLLGQQGELDHSPPLVNGQYQPTIYMAPGEVQRWRMVNENATKSAKAFEVAFSGTRPGERLRAREVARDGVQLAPENYDTAAISSTIPMAPGQRVDVFVRAPRSAGTHYAHIRHNAASGRRSRNPSLPVDPTLGGAKADSIVVLRVVVDPALRGRNTRMPRTLPLLPEFLRDSLPAARDTALIVFTDSLSQEPTQFYLGSRLNPFQRYDDNRVFVPSDTNGQAMPMVLGQTQTWKIVNNSQQGINHPFHIHINPFQVNRVVYPLGENDPYHELYEQLNAAAERGSPIWLDVLPLPQPAITTTTLPLDTIRADSLVPLGSGEVIAFPDTSRNRVAVAPFPTTVQNGTPNTAYVVITQKYDVFQGCPDGSCGPPTGYFVMHCHILGHEERGMMQVLQVVEPGQPVSPPGSGHGAHHPGGQGQQRQDPQPQHRH